MNSPEFPENKEESSENKEEFFLEDYLFYGFIFILGSFIVFSIILVLWHTATTIWHNYKLFLKWENWVLAGKRLWSTYVICECYLCNSQDASKRRSNMAFKTFWQIKVV